MTPLSDLAFHVLLALGDGPSHGYAIGKDVEERSGGRLDPTTGTLYQVLQRLAEGGHITSARSPAGTDERRKYFALTAQGRRAVAEEASRLDALVRAARKLGLYPHRA
jgi:DNA-binding PadR family transcriptional regulator